MNYISSAKDITSIDSSPIVDAACEIRYNARVETNLIPGLLHVALAKDGVDAQIADIESAHLIPAFLRTTDPALRNIHLFEFDHNSVKIRFGPGSLLISACTPYPGWAIYSADIDIILSLFERSGVMEDIERVGIRFINFIESASIDSSLNVSVSSSFTTEENSEHCIPLEVDSTSIAVTYKSGDRYARLSIQSPVKYTDSANSDKTGILVDIDAFYGDDNIVHKTLSTTIDQLHELAKSIFFSSVKSESLGHIYLKQELS